MRALVEAVRSAKTPAERGMAVVAFLRDEGQIKAAAELPEQDLEVFDVELRAAKLPATDARRVLSRVRRARATPVKMRLASPDESASFDVDGELFEVPGGYTLDGQGQIRRLEAEGEGKVIAHRQLLITRLWKDLETQREVVDLAWQCEHGWQRKTVSRLLVMDSRQIVTLADYGCPVASVSAVEIVRFLKAQSENLDKPMGAALSRCGWLPGGDFALGSRTVGGTELRLVADEGASQVADALHEAGTFEGWLQAVAGVRERPQVMVALYASVAACMLKPLGIEGGGVVHWACESSSGKTTSLRLGASVWGPPGLGDGLIGSWDATAKWLEERASFSCDLPLLLDETSHIPEKGREQAARLVYGLTSGTGRGRGTRGGSEAMASFRTVCLSTGEAPITDWCRQAGVAARVLEVRETPCESAEQSRALSWGLSEHYGHLGPRVVEAMRKASPEALRKAYRARVEHWTSQGTGGGVEARLGAFMALLEAAAKTCRTLGVDCDVDRDMAWIWGVMCAQVADRDECAQAIAVIEAKIAREGSRIQGEGEEYPANRDVIARRVEDGYAVPSVTFSVWMREHGLNGSTVKKQLLDRGLAEVRTVKLLGMPVKCVIVHVG